MGEQKKIFISDLGLDGQGHPTAMLVQQVASVYRATLLALFGTLFVSAILAITLFAEIDHFALGSWLGAIWFLSLIRFLVWQRFNKASDEEKIGFSWHWLLIVGSVLSGLLWGLTSWWIWPESLAHQAFVVMLLSGMAAASLSVYAPLLSVSVPFVVLITFPTIAHFWLEGGAFGQWMSYTILLFFCVITFSAWRLSCVMRNNFEARFGQLEAEKELQREALFDPLTNLPNRRFFLERLQQEFSRTKRHNRTGALLFLDLDNFKTINDSLGHHIGDLLLQQVADRLKKRFRDEDIAGRLGGDEFVVLLPDVAVDPVSAIYEVESVAAQLRTLLTEPYKLDGHELIVSGSIGVALFPDNSDSYQDVLKHADTAMYRAKEEGRNAYRFFMPDMQEAATQRLLIERDLRQAIGSAQLNLHYQPQVNVDGVLVGLEALSRWHHPEHGDLSPSVFIPIADESALVFELHRWVVARVCRDMKQIIEHYGHDAMPIVSINVSARAFHQVNFEESLLNEIRQAGVPTEKICLEITETSVMKEVDVVIYKMQSLRRAGITFSIDDFGTGYSSLSYLKRLPVNSLKIDQTFVRDITTDKNDAVIVETILAMSRHLGLKVVAEGVESKQAEDFLRERGCIAFQGWLYGRAQPLEKILASYACCTEPNQ